MAMAAVIDVVIGLVLMYLLLSLICTVVNEFLASFTMLRARNLSRGIKNIVDDPNLHTAFRSTGLFKMAGSASGRKGPSYIPAKTFAKALVDAVDPEGKSSIDRKMSDVNDAIGKLNDSAVKATLAALARDAQDDFDKYRDATAAWFDEMMDRLSGVHKRQMQLISLSVAVILSVAVNADSVQVATALWNDEALRNAIAQSASELVLNSGEVGELTDLAAINEELRPFPVGWDFDSPPWSGDWHRSVGGWILKVLGILFTAVAVSLGAPFWFDLLNKFTNLRGSGAAPQRKTSEGSA